MIEHRIGTSRRSDLVHTVSRVVLRPALRYYPLAGPATKVIPMMDRVAQLTPRSSRTVHQTVTARTWRGELVTPIDGATSDGAILYLHGGAFLMCGLATHRRIVERLAYRTGMPVLSVDYRQIPQGTVEDGISDCADAFTWLVRSGHSSSKIILAGDSAGGHLSFATTLKVMRDGHGTPAGVVGMSPWLDFDHQPKLKHHNARRDAYIPVRRLRRVGRMAVGNRVEKHHSPVNADLTGFPPSLIICGHDEILRVDAELMAERLLDAGVKCTLQVWEGQIHAFPVMADLTPEGKQAVEEVATFATQCVANAGAGRGTGVGGATVGRIGVA